MIRIDSVNEEQLRLIAELRSPWPEPLIIYRLYDLNRPIEIMFL